MAQNLPEVGRLPNMERSNWTKMFTKIGCLPLKYGELKSLDRGVNNIFQWGGVTQFFGYESLAGKLPL